MEIKKGDRFRCNVKNLEWFEYGEIYTSPSDSFIQSNQPKPMSFEKNLYLVDKWFDRIDSPTSPSHYKAYDIEAIEMMIRIWGKEEAAIFCKLNAFKYRLRMGMKDDIKIELEKESKYLAKWKELRDDVTG